MKRGKAGHRADPDPQSGNGRAYDALIRRAAPRVPNPGASRRNLRTLLHHRMREAKARKRWWRRLGLPAAAFLAFVTVFAGQIGILGSDGWEPVPDGELMIEGEAHTRLRSPVRGRVRAAPPGISADGVRDLQEATRARDIAPTGLIGTGLDDGPVHWFVSYPVDADGIALTETGEPPSLGVPNHPSDRALHPVMLEHFAAFLDDLERGTVPARPQGRIDAEGVTFDVERFDRHFPGLGTLNYYVGRPAS